MDIEIKVLACKEIKGFSNYLLFEDGTVYSKKRTKKGKGGSRLPVKGKWLTLKENKWGYDTVHLRQDGKSKHSRVCRMVITHFSPVEGMDNLQCNHIDENKKNDYIGNLEWMTPQENTEYSQARHFKVEHPCGKVTYEFNVNKFCREYGLHAGSVGNVLRGERPHHKQFKFNYTVQP